MPCEILNNLYGKAGPRFVGHSTLEVIIKFIFYKQETPFNWLHNWERKHFSLKRRIWFQFKRNLDIQLIYESQIAFSPAPASLDDAEHLFIERVKQASATRLCNYWQSSLLSVWWCSHMTPSLNTHTLSKRCEKHNFLKKY